MDLISVAENHSLERVLSLVTLRRGIQDMVEEVRLIDQFRILHCHGESGAPEPINLPAAELTHVFNGLVKVGQLLRKTVPGLFIEKITNAEEARSNAVARLALGQYLASLAGGSDLKATLRTINQWGELTNRSEDIAFSSSSDGCDPSTTAENGPRVPHLGEKSLLDQLLPQWRKIGDPAWVSPLKRYRGNWLEKGFMTGFEALAKRLLLHFLARGWRLEDFRRNRTEARRRFFEAYRQLLALAGQKCVALRSMYPHLDKACEWMESDRARQELVLLQELDLTRIKDEIRRKRKAGSCS